MNISGILVVVSPSDFEAGVSALNGLPRVEVHHSDPKTGRIVVTQEADSVNDEVEGLKRIKALPGVAMAEMVYHYLGAPGRVSGGISPGADGGKDVAEVPASLNE